MEINKKEPREKCIRFVLNLYNVFPNTTCTYVRFTRANILPFCFLKTVRRFFPTTVNFDDGRLMRPRNFEKFAQECKCVPRIALFFFDWMLLCTPSTSFLALFSFLLFSSFLF